MVKAKLASEEMGRKRQCPSCSGRFYDLGKSPAECPYCETTFNPEDQLKGRRRGSTAAAEAPKPVEKPKPKPETEDDLPEVEDVEPDDDEDDDDVLEDASDLEDDDVSDVVQKGEREEDS